MKITAVLLAAGQGEFVPLERPGCRPTDILSVLIESRSVAGAVKSSPVSIPPNVASEMRANGGDDIKALRPAEDKDAVCLQKCHRIRREIINAAESEYRRRLVQDIGH